MKELWAILLEKVREVESTLATIILGVCGLFTIGMATIVTCKFFTMIIRIVEVFGQSDVSKKGF
jgi:hypothetical protein